MKGKQSSKLKRLKLILKCKDCGKRYTVKTDKPMICPECKNSQWFCHGCQTYFEPGELCLRCRWFVCPKCGACGCNYRGRVRKIKRFLLGRW